MTESAPLTSRSAPRAGILVTGTEVLTGRTLPSANANWTTPACQLPNWPMNGVVGPWARGNAVPAFRPVTYTHLDGCDE